LEGDELVGRYVVVVVVLGFAILNNDKYWEVLMCESRLFYFFGK
jgi:hypothetical protein